ncbi:uncharacterized protein BDR25DRAFT_235349, partial [Lindgomyces ingoldianus]
HISPHRAAVIATFIGGGIVVPWKAVTSTESLLCLITSVGIFLEPIIAISISDYLYRIVKARRIYVSSLYHPHSRYRYIAGMNWRAAAALLRCISPA